MKVKKSAANATIKMEYRMAKFVTDWKSGDTQKTQVAKKQKKFITVPRYRHKNTCF